MEQGIKDAIISIDPVRGRGYDLVYVSTNDMDVATTDYPGVHSGLGRAFVTSKSRGLMPRKRASFENKSY